MTSQNFCRLVHLFRALLADAYRAERRRAFWRGFFDGLAWPLWLWRRFRG